MLLGWILKKSHIYLESFCGAYHEFSVSVAHIKLHSLLSEEAERRIAAPCFVLGHVQEVDFFFLNLFLCYNSKITVTSQERRNSFRQ